MTEVTLTIDGIKTTVKPGTTVLQAADSIGIHIPRLCYHPHLSIPGACRVCLVEIQGVPKPVTSCNYAVQEGMKVSTHSAKLRQLRRDIVELILNNHPQDCQTCERNSHCELQKLAYELGVRERLFHVKERNRHPKDLSSFAVIRNPEKCIFCGRCVRVCDEIQGVSNLSQHHRGTNMVVAPAYEKDMQDSVCVHCGQCANVCPTAALLEHSYTDDVFRILMDPKKHVVVQTAPSIRAAIGEGFGYPIGTPVTGKMVTALRLMGFAKVFDTNFAADLTIIEEATEFLHRLEKNEKLPLITSCSPGWINFMEHFYPELIPYASTCKSPMSMLSSLLKTYYAKKAGIDPKDIYVVGIMPCTAKKYEAKRAEHTAPEGYPYTDAVLTTREIIWMMKSYGIDFKHLPEGDFDSPLGESSGAADIFGTTGGVMEAALRTAYEKLTGNICENLDFHQVRGVEGAKEAELQINGKTISIAVANGLNNAKKVLNKLKSGEKQYHLIEIMACPGGCISGGGQPYPPEGMHILDPELTQQRAKALYAIDSNKKIRKSHENESILKLYEEFLGTPNGHKAHELLHTHYNAKLPKGIV
ncbi:MAG: iron hydrogenase small subunit [Candidatus Brocadiae bacterium]|nr:iron hydrogenase small subunit [Candidatus Brocadiia bacterium]